MSIKSKMTAIADRIRSILGITDTMGLDDMSDNLAVCQDTVELQADLLDQAILALADKAAGTGGSAGPVLQSKTITPTESEQMVVPDEGFDGLSSVSVDAVSKIYVGSDIPRINEYAITPGVDDYVIPDNVYLDGAQTVLGDKDLVAENIKQGIEIFGVEGSYSGVDVSDGDAASGDIAAGKVAYTKEGRIVGEIEVIEKDMGLGYQTDSMLITDRSYGPVLIMGKTMPEKHIFDTGSSIDLEIGASELGDASPDDVVKGKTFTSESGIKLTGTYIPKSGIDASDSTALAEDILEGKVAYTAEGRVIGTMMELSGSTTMPSTDHSFWSDGTGDYFELTTAPGVRFAISDDVRLGVYVEASELGDATAGDVVSGKTFTSANGMKLTGAYTPAGGLPNGISHIDSGTFQLSSSSNSKNIAHNLGVTPNFLNVMAVGDVTGSNFYNYAISYSLFNIQLKHTYGSAPVNGAVLFGQSDGFPETTFMSAGPVSSFFTATNISAELPDDIQFKAGVTYRWICGLADF